MRAALAGLLAFAASLALEYLVARLLGAQGVPEATVLLRVGVLVAPWLEELAKFLSLRAMHTHWAGTGLAFGVFEGLLKLRNGMEPVWVMGAVSSVLFHWGLGRMAGRARWGLLWAILLHTGFNALYMFGALRQGPVIGLVTLGFAALLLASTFLWPRRPD